MIAATGMVVTLYAYALRELRIARMVAMRNYMRRVVREEMNEWARGEAGKPYDWGGTA